MFCLSVIFLVNGVMSKPAVMHLFNPSEQTQIMGVWMLEANTLLSVDYITFTSLLFLKFSLRIAAVYSRQWVNR